MEEAFQGFQEPQLRDKLQRDERRNERQQRDPNDRTIYIGKKSLMNYVIAVVTQFNNGLPEVKLKARGRSISAAVDVTQITKNRFIPMLKIKDINLSTEELISEDGRNTRVSSIEITMTK